MTQQGRRGWWKNGIPLGYQIVALLVGGLIVAQVCTLSLTVILPEKAPPKYRMAEVARALQGGPLKVGNPRPLVRTIRSEPPSFESPNWVVSDASRQDLAQLLGVPLTDVRILFYSPTPLAGGRPSGLTGARPVAAADDPSPETPAPFDGRGAEAGLIKAALVTVADLQAPAGGPGGGPFPGGGLPGGGFPGGGFPGGGLPGGGMPGSGLPGGGMPSAAAPAPPRASPGGGFPNAARRPDTAPAPRAGAAPQTGPATQAGSFPQNGPAQAAPSPGVAASTPAPAGGQSAGVPATNAHAGNPAGYAGAGVPGGSGGGGGPGPGGPAAPGGGAGAPGFGAGGPLSQAGGPGQPIRPYPPEAPGAERTERPSSSAADAGAGAAAARADSDDPRPVREPSSPVVTAVDGGVRLAEPGQATGFVLSPADSGGYLLPNDSAPVRGLFGMTSTPFLQGDFVAALKVGPDRWVTVQPAPEKFPTTTQRRIAMWFLLSCLIVVPAGLLFARRLAAPLVRFADAAERLGRDPTGSQAPLGGPAEIGRAARAFNQMQGRLKRYIDDRTAMVGAISHDLRTPLARMRFRLERIPPQFRDGMSNDIGQMDDMIGAVLTFIRDASEPSVRERVELRSILECVVDNATLMGGEVRLDPGERVPVDVDTLSVERVLTNLIDNALKYGDRAHVRVFEDGPDVVAEVEDEGPGLPDEELEKVFLPFYRSDQSRNLNKPGIGLGLAVSRSIARAHGGDINLSRGRHGLKAQLRLPRAPMAA